MSCCPHFPPILARLRKLGGRSRRIERKLDAVFDQLTRMETMMTTSSADLLAEAKEIHAAVTAVMKTKADEITAAVAKAKAAWDADNEADHAAALAEMEAIKTELSNPPAFSPSAN